jgi:hypothetical protein
MGQNTIRWGAWVFLSLVTLVSQKLREAKITMCWESTSYELKSCLKIQLKKHLKKSKINIKNI